MSDQEYFKIDGLTITDERERIDRDRFKKAGTRCKCCGSQVKAYRRKIIPSMVYFLLWLAEEYENFGTVIPHNYREYIHEKGRFPADYTKLQLWGLIKPSGVSGVWYLTQRGILFARGDLKTSKYLEVYKNKVIGYSKEKASIRDCFADPFEYDQIFKTLRESERETKTGS